MVLPWGPCGIPLGPIWYSLVVWGPYGTPLGAMWYSLGVHMVLPGVGVGVGLGPRLKFGFWLKSCLSLA